MYSSSSYTLRWENFPGTTVRIDLYKGAVSVQTIATAAAKHRFHHVCGSRGNCHGKRLQDQNQLIL